ncbi:MULTISPECIES: DNA polymerase III subunit delta [Metabacillus]|uniref:DNA polymerase III subunit delta n=2 Tax=Metabacillus TaxID=2675233 RepID=A0A179SUQ1_9BACI|nr:MULTISPECIES: DNA polymerase III subunit delta [Metabacillus]OAS85008.1 DNA polymerase III subunit delta [Metabacillus litoralis]QNF26299.1 DNA polymerase III subunit delta [Metabacillus sp. KUDC1714]
MIFNVWNDIKKKKLHSTYLLIGKETFLMQETVQLIVNASLMEEEKDFNLSVYDMEETSIETALEDAETLPFMGEKRVIILKNPVFLTSEKKKEKIEHRIDKLEQYMNSPAPYTILIFLAPYEKLDERKKITKLIKKQSVLLEMKTLSDDETIKWITDIAEQEAIYFSKEAMEELMLLTAGDLMIMHQELKKLSTYVGEGGSITPETVRLLVARSLEQNIFDLIDHVIHRRSKDALQIFYDLLKNNEEPIKILSLLVNQFRLILQVKELANTGYGQQQIATTVKVHPFRVKLALQQAKLFKAEELAHILMDLAEADYEMKTGKKEKQLLLELFLLKLFQK